MKRKKLSIVIVNYQSRAYLQKCLASIFSKINQAFSFEVIVVNNDACENLIDLEGQFPEVKLIQNFGNTGFGMANNFGTQKADGEFLLFLNPDTEIVSDNIFAVLDEFENNENIGVIGSCLLQKEKVIQKWICGKKVSLWHLVKNNLTKTDDEKCWLSQTKLPVFWVAGTAMFVRRNLFLEVGGFDENFFMYFEDVDFCARVWKRKKQVIYFPEFLVLHHGGKSFGERKKQKQLYYKSQDYYFKKHRSFFERQLLKVLRAVSF